MILTYGIAHCPAYWHVDEYTAPGFSRFYYVKGGEAQYDDRNGSRSLREGHFYVLPTAVPYRLRHNPDNPLICVYLHMDFFLENLTVLRDIPVGDDPVLFNMLETLTECIGREREKLVEILSDALILYCREEGLINLTRSLLTPILEYISGNLDRNLSIDELSRRAGYNGQYFIRLFKDELGTTPYQYIISRRMEKAKALLKTEASITEISEKTGFADVKSFSRAFRKYNLISPSSYRDKPLRVP